MKTYITFLALFLSCSWSSFAQTADAPAAELASTPPALAPDGTTPVLTENRNASEIKFNRKISYGLSAGTQFSRVLGTATYLEPSIMVPVTKRFSGYASLNMITVFNPSNNLFGRSEFSANNAFGRNQQYILNVGGNYLVNDRLNLTGSIWRDLSKNPRPGSVNLLMPGGTNGMSLRANYKVTENFSVSGGIRYSNGNPYQNSWYNPASPFGY